MRRISKFTKIKNSTLPKAVCSLVSFLEKKKPKNKLKEKQEEKKEFDEEFFTSEAKPRKNAQGGKNRLTSIPEPNKEKQNDNGSKSRAGNSKVMDLSQLLIVL